MEHLTYRDDVFEKFDIFHNEKNYRSLNKFTFSKKKIDKLLNSEYLVPYDNSNDAYKYYLYRDLKHVLKWYKRELFQLFKAEEYFFDYSKPERFILIVKNNQTGRVDNIISKEHFDVISNRIKSNGIIYNTSKHAVRRSQFRISRLVDVSNQWKVDDWLCKQVNEKCYPCKLKKQYTAINLLDHNFEQCQYYMDEHGFVYVVHNHMLLTVHCNESKRYIRN